MYPQNSSDNYWREGLLTRVSIVYAAIFFATVALSAVLMRVSALLWFGVILGAAQVLAMVMKRRSVAYRPRAWVMIMALVGASAVFYLFAGINPGPVLAFAFALVLTTLLLGKVALLGVLAMMIAFLMSVTAAMWLDIWRGPMPAIVGTPTPDVWFQTTIVSALFWAAIGFSISFVVGALEKTVVRLREKEVQRREADKARREAEARVAQSQKLEALGQLAAGIAHDFNNALLVMRGWTDLLKTNDTPQLRAQAEEAIDQALDQGEQLASQLLTFGRKQWRSPRYLSVSELVESTGRTLSRIVRSTIELTIDAAPAGFVLADENQLQQVLLNLVINAGDAMPDGGTVTVRSRLATAEEAADLPSGQQQWAVLQVEDDGQGMDAGTQARIFEPFFTTKQVGKGTGLGLATVFGIVEQSNAHIRVSSEPGNGACFTILFPSIDIPKERAAVEDIRKPRLDGNGRRVLVLEDDPLARDLVVFALKRNRFQVTVAGSGDDAIALINGDGDRFDILSTDAMFPGASLADVINAFEQANPAGKVLICSGFMPDDTYLEPEKWQRYESLPKPFTAEQLVTKLSAMLTG